jgi:hypothetical protein
MGPPPPPVPSPPAPRPAAAAAVYTTTTADGAQRIGSKRQQYRHGQLPSAGLSSTDPFDTPRCQKGCKPEKHWKLRMSMLFFWLAFGVFHNFHLTLIACIGGRCCGCRRRCICNGFAPGAGRFVRRRIAQHWVSLVSFGTLGGVCRGIGAVRCEGGEDMSRRCLFNQQDWLYVVCYVLHFVAAGWMILQWLFDGLSIWGWAAQVIEGEPLANFGIPGSAKRVLRLCFGERAAEVHDARLAATMAGDPSRTSWKAGWCCGSATVMEVACALAVAVITVTWTVFSDWSTGGSNSTNSLPDLTRALCWFAVMYSMFTVGFWSVTVETPSADLDPHDLVAATRVDPAHEYQRWASLQYHIDDPTVAADSQGNFVLEGTWSLGQLRTCLNVRATRTVFVRSLLACVSSSSCAVSSLQQGDRVIECTRLLVFCC